MLAADVQAAVEAAIIQQATSGESSRSIAQRMGVHYQTVANIRRRLEKAGVLVRLRRGVRLKAGSVQLPTAGMGPQEAAAALLPLAPDGTLALDSVGIMTPEQVLKRLSWMAMAPQVPHPVQVQASKALYDIGEAERVRASLTSTEPKTPQEAAERLLMLRNIVGGAAWEKAHEAANMEEAKWTAEAATRRELLSPLSSSSSG